MGIQCFFPLLIYCSRILYLESGPFHSKVRFEWYKIKSTTLKGKDPSPFEKWIFRYGQSVCYVDRIIFVTVNQFVMSTVELLWR